MAKMTAQFNRFGMWRGETFALSRFLKQHTEINELYWSFVPVAGYGDYLARHAVQPITTSSMLHFTGPDARRLEPSTDVWRKHFKEFQNWVRLSALMSAVSYLEVYLRDCTTMAVRSDPLSRYGSPRAMDGLVWLKRGLKMPPDRDIKLCLVGEWPKRAKGIRHLFRSVPTGIANNISDLEQIRKLRNSIGHAFGRSLSAPRDVLGLSVAGQERLSEDRLKRWLGLMSDIAVSFDREIGMTHIGEFERLLIYHQWKTLPRLGKSKSYAEDKAFARYLSTKIGGSPGVKFCASLIAFYNAT